MGKDLQRGDQEAQQYRPGRIRHPDPGQALPPETQEEDRRYRH